MVSVIAIELDGQYRALRDAVGLLDRSERGKLLVEGPDATGFLQGQITNDVEALAPGEGCYAALLDRKGHMEADLRVLRVGANTFWLDTEATTRDALARHLELYRVGRDVELRDVTTEHALHSLIGPAAAQVLDQPPRGLEHTHLESELTGLSCRAIVTDVGIDVISPAQSDAGIRAMLLGAGAEDVSEDAAEIVRVESGRPRYGSEMTQATIPQEAGINDRAVSLTKGCYIGQETVARLHYKGKPNRHLRGLRFDANAAAGDSIHLGERDAGRVGTAVLSPALGPIGLAIVRREVVVGDRVDVAGTTTAEVVELPFVDPSAELG